MENQDVVCGSKGACTQLITLNRPRVLNTLTLEMIQALLAKYRYLNSLPEQSVVVVLRGAGKKAFCAGGDVIRVVKKVTPKIQQQFFYYEYQMNYAVLTLKQPQVALWDGIVMGGGVGISVHGSHRVATERALFAMPETKIGLFPDVGGSWFLPRLKINRGLGLYLALTGKRVKGADLVHAGIATHYVHSQLLPALETDLCNLPSPAALEQTLSKYASAELPSFTLADELPLIEEHFGRNPKSVEAIFKSLETAASTSKWCREQLKVLYLMSPSSLKLSFAMHLKGGMIKDSREIFKMEYRAIQRVVQRPDFTSGITALLIDKTGRTPKWNPPFVDDVTDADLNSYFVSLPAPIPDWSPTEPYPGDSKL